MSGLMIKDGTGKGFVAKVDAENRLHTHAFTVTIDQAAALAGDAFTVSSGVVILTSDNKSAVFYFKNTSSDDFLLTIQSFFAGNSTNGASTAVGFDFTTGTGLAGTIVSNADPGPSLNARINSSAVLDSDIFAGAEGYTLSGGTTSSFVSDGFVNLAATVLPPGNAMAVEVTPSTGNTSQVFQFTVNLIRNASLYGND